MKLLSLDDLPASRRDGPFRTDDFSFNAHDKGRFDALRSDDELGTDMVRTAVLRARSSVPGVNWINNSIPIHDGQLAIPSHTTPSGLIETVGHTPGTRSFERNEGISNRILGTEVGHVISFRPETEKLFFDQARGGTWNRVMQILLTADKFAPGKGVGGRFGYFKYRPLVGSIGDFVDDYLAKFKITNADSLVEAVTFYLLSEFSNRFGDRAICDDGTPEVIFRDNEIRHISINVLSAYGGNSLTPKDSTSSKRIAAMFMKKLPEYGIQVDQHYCAQLAEAVLKCFERAGKERE